MSSLNPISLTVDLERPFRTMKNLVVTQNTDVVFDVKILKDGQPVTLTGTHVYTLTTVNAHRKTHFSPEEGVLTGGNVVQFKLGSEQVAVAGGVKASIQIVSEDERVDTLPFEFSIVSDLTRGAVESTDENSLFHKLFHDVPQMVDNAKRDLVSTEGVRTATESERLATKAERLATEEVRTTTIEVRDETIQVKQAAEEATAETVKMTASTQEIRDLVEGTYAEYSQLTEDARQATAQTQDAITFANQQGNFALQVAEENKTRFLPPVATVALRNSTYPTPTHGDTIRVTEEARTYRYSDGAWVVTDEYNATAIDNLSSKVSRLDEAERKKQVLTSGVQVIEAEEAGALDLEFHGRTLTSMANSNLEALKYYALADPKTKVIVDKKTVSGVGKFQKAQTTKTVADFAGKVRGSTVANPHTFWADNRSSLVTPTTLRSGYERDTNHYNGVSNLDNHLYDVSTRDTGSTAQHFFSFNVVEQIERELGLIPRESLAEKVQWVKDNILRLQHAWHGFGSSPLGNKAYFAEWRATEQKWVNALSHTNPEVTRILNSISEVISPTHIDPNGFAHYLAYAEPSDGITPSVINTDYVNLEITLKPTAKLNTRGKIIRVENFEGKVRGSNLENPHRFSRVANSSLMTPSEILMSSTERSSEGYRAVSILDGTTDSLPHTQNGFQTQHLFSFNLIEAVERNVGKIPAGDVAGKVAWLKANLFELRPKWYGFGSSVNGNKATLATHSPGGWISANNHIAPVPTLIQGSVNSINMGRVDSDGLIHFLAYAEPSDGVTASTISTDYIELEIELKPTANFHTPKVPLYEVSKAEYDKIGIQWDDAEVKKRFPAVVGTQHLVNPYVMAEGENLLPPFSEWTFSTKANIKNIGPYEVIYSISEEGNIISDVTFNVVKGQTYFFSVGENDVTIQIRRGDTGIMYHYPSLYGSHKSTSFTTDSETIVIRLYNNNRVGELKISNPMLTLGSEPKPFVPRNPSYLYVQEKLGAIGAKKDVLFKEDGKWKVSKTIESLIIDNSFTWMTAMTRAGYKIFRYDDLIVTDRSSRNFNPDSLLFDYRGMIMPRAGNSAESIHSVNSYSSSSRFVYIAISNEDSGMSEEYSPDSNDIKRYFNGWKYSDGTTWTSVTGNGQTATAQQALDTKPTDYTPYKLSYVLANPVVEEANVEGDIAVNGLTQAEVGSGVVVREKVVPIKYSNDKYYINNLKVGALSKLSNKVKKILSIYRNGVKDSLWTIRGATLDTYGLSDAELSEDFDPTAEYTVTYTVLDKAQFTADVFELPVWYHQSLASSVKSMVNTQSDQETKLSIHESAILEFYIRLKALEG